MKRPPIIATLLMLLGVAILCSLGTWQLHRLEWKTDLLQKLDAEYEKDAAATILSSADLKDDFLFKRGTLSGTLNYDKEVRVGPRVYEHITGYHIVTPLVLDDGTILLVNRGWVSDAWHDEHEGTEAIFVTGLLREPVDNSFAPPNDPVKGRWYNIAPDEIAAAKDLDNISHYVLYVENNDPRVPYPIAAATKPDFPNSHLQYALFWFFMAGTLVTVYALRFLRKQK